MNNSIKKELKRIIKDYCLSRKYSLIELSNAAFTKAANYRKLKMDNFDGKNLPSIDDAEIFFTTILDVVSDVCCKGAVSCDEDLKIDPESEKKIKDIIGKIVLEYGMSEQYVQDICAEINKICQKLEQK